MRSLLAIIPLAVLTGCHTPPPPPSAAAQAEVQPPLEAKACAVVKQAILARHNSPPATFGTCNAYSSNGIDYTVGVAIKIGQIGDEDNPSRVHMDTFYYADAKLDPATGEMRAGSLVHD